MTESANIFIYTNNSKASFPGETVYCFSHFASIRLLVALPKLLIQWECYYSRLNFKCIVWRFPNIPKFTFQNSIWLILISGLLETERMNVSYNGTEITNMNAYPYIFILWDLCPFWRMTQIQDPDSNHLRSSLSENVVFCWTSICLNFQSIPCPFDSPRRSKKKKEKWLLEILVSLNNPIKNQLIFNFQGIFFVFWNANVLHFRK